jgi:hypothetical protein
MQKLAPRMIAKDNGRVRRELIYDEDHGKTQKPDLNLACREYRLAGKLNGRHEILFALDADS